MEELRCGRVLALVVVEAAVVENLGFAVGEVVEAVAASPCVLLFCVF